MLQGQSPDVVREINFEAESGDVTTPKVLSSTQKSRPRRQDANEEADDANGNEKIPNGNAGGRRRKGHGRKGGGEMQMSEAEELLKRLKEL